MDEQMEPVGSHPLWLSQQVAEFVPPLPICMSSVEALLCPYSCQRSLPGLLWGHYFMAALLADIYGDLINKLVAACNDAWLAYSCLRALRT